MRSNVDHGEADAIQPPASHPFFPKVEETEIGGGEEDQRETKIPPNRATKTKACIEEGGITTAKICGEANDSTPTEEHEMRRANTFVLAPTRAQEEELRRLATGCAKLWNEVNYQRRQAYTNHQPIDWNSQLYKKYRPSIGATTAQQVVRKNSEAWRSFLALKKLERRGELPPHIKKVSPPRYWKRDGRYELVILCRNDSYRIEGDIVKLPRDLSIGFKGDLRWSGRQGRLEVRYDQLAKKWRVFQPVVVKPVLSPKGSKTCHIDLGVRNLGTVLAEGWSKPIAFNSGNILADWWYWTKRIAAHQARLWRINRRKTSKTLGRLYRKRQKRFRHAVDAFARQLISELYDLGVSKIVLGDLNRIRLNGEEQSHQTNAMIHNFWSHGYLAQRIRWTAEEHGITVVEVSEAHTSDTCPRCRSRNSERRGRLFRCRHCGLEAHRDAVGVANMASLNGEKAVGVVAHPLLLKWDGCGWKPSRAMPIQARMNRRETRISRLKSGECQLRYFTDDPETRVVVLYIEGVRNGKEFVEVTKETVKKKPVVVYKAGRTNVGARATLSHTGSLAGMDAIFEAACKQAGVIRMYEAFHPFDLAEALVNQPLPRGNRVVVIGSGGGYCVTCSDACESMGLEVPEFDAETQAKLKAELLPHAATPRNPIDTAADQRPLTYAKLTEMVAQLPYIDGIIIMPPLAGYDIPDYVRSALSAAETIATIPKKYGKPIIATGMRSRLVGPAVAVLRNAGIPFYETPEDCARAMCGLAKYAQNLDKLKSS